MNTFIESGADNIVSITATNNVYSAKSGYGIKFSSTKAAGSITLKLANAVNATTIVVNAAKYGDDASTLSVNDVNAQTLNGTEFQDYTFEINKEISEIKLASGAKKQRLYVKSVTVNYTVEEDNREGCGLAYSAATATVTVGQEPYELPTLDNTHGLAVKYESSNTAAATISAEGVVTISEDSFGETEISATFAGDDTYKPGKASYVLTVVNDNLPGQSAEKPYTVAQAIAACPSTGSLNDVYVKGIITSVGSFNSNYGSITYYVGDEAGATTTLQIYSGLNKNGEKFSSADDLAVGGTVIVKGNLKMYNSAPEIDLNSWVIEYTAPEKLTVDTPTFSPAGGEVEKGATVTIACATDGATIRYAVAANAEDINEADAENWEIFNSEQPIVIDEAVTIKAIAMKDGCINSNIATASYTVYDKAKTMEFNFTDPTKLTPAQAASGTIKVSDVKFWSYSISFTATKGTSTDATIYYNNGKGNLRVYNGATMTIVSEDAEQNNITTIIFTLRQGAANAITEVASASKQVASAPLKTISSSNGNKTYTWTGDAKEVNLNVASNIQIENLQVTCANQISTGVDDVMVDGNEEAPVEYYNLQGVRVENPAAGQLYIKRQGSKATKVIVR